MLRVSGFIPERFPDYSNFKTLQFHAQLGHKIERNRSHVQYLKACSGTLELLYCARLVMVNLFHMALITKEIAL